jgi:hypothetical protein
LDHIQVNVNDLLDGSPECIPKAICLPSERPHPFEGQGGADVLYVEIARLIFHVMIVEEVHREPELFRAGL